MGAGVYIAYHYATPQIRAWRFRDAMTQTARLASVNSDAEMRSTLRQAAEELGIPLEPGALQIHRGPGGRIVVSAAWHEAIEVDGGPLGVWIDTLYYAYEVGSMERKAR